jgi:hypothetical protein
MRGSAAMTYNGLCAAVDKLYLQCGGDPEYDRTLQQKVEIIGESMAGLVALARHAADTLDLFTVNGQLYKYEQTRTQIAALADRLRQTVSRFD